MIKLAIAIALTLVACGDDIDPVTPWCELSYADTMTGVDQQVCISSRDGIPCTVCKADFEIPATGCFVPRSGSRPDHALCVHACSECY